MIETSRLILTQLVPSDAEAMFAYRSDPEVTRFQSWAPRSLEELRAFIDDLGWIEIDTPGKWYQLAIRAKDGDVLVGDVGIHVRPDEPLQAEIGYTVAPAHQRRGYASEAVAALLGYLFDQLGKHRVYASADPRNEASLHVLRHVGMRQEAHFRQSLWCKDEWADDVVFAMLGSEWRERV